VFISRILFYLLSKVKFAMYGSSVFQNFCVGRQQVYLIYNRVSSLLRSQINLLFGLRCSKFSQLSWMYISNVALSVSYNIGHLNNIWLSSSTSFNVCIWKQYPPMSLASNMLRAVDREWFGLYWFATLKKRCMKKMIQCVFIN
jgi:hypothetical protein